ncbi:MAG: ThiF family adenylyltransferase, partial [Alphaproteobacteria bacterium]
LGRPKVAVLAEMARDINPELAITGFPHGIDEANIDAFLDGVDLFVDGFDFFALDIRAAVFARCAERGIPAITAAPLGMGAAYLVFMPGGMTFEEYFRLRGLDETRRYVNFVVGLNPKGYHRAYLMDPSRIDLAGNRGPSTVMACQLCAGVAGVEALKILLGRGPVRAAPHYHQFDAYRGKWRTGWLPGGNRHPLQTLKRRIGYRLYARLSRDAWPQREAAGVTEIERILDLARWAPSGDNGQPWRFEITGEDTLTIHLRDQADDDVYDYNGGQPTLLSAGFLLETLRIAASRYGRLVWWRYRGAHAHDHAIDVELPKTPGIAEDALHAFVAVRSVDRRPYRLAPLAPAEKRALEASLGDEFAIDWHETPGARWRMARINARATDIRLNIPEAFRVHRRILDWSRRFSPTGVPVGAVGLDALALGLMRWAMADWKRMRRLNRLPGGTLIARLEMDLVPGLLSAAHFAVVRKTPPAPGDEAAALLRAGQALQRFWLTATALGLAMQPALAPVIFAHYARHGVAFTAEPGIAGKAAALARDLGEAHAGADDALLFTGRLGRSRSRAGAARSLRRPLDDLLIARRAPETATPNDRVGEEAAEA